VDSIGSTDVIWQLFINSGILQIASISTSYWPTESTSGDNPMNQPCEYLPVYTNLEARFRSKHRLDSAIDAFFLS